MLSVVHLRPTTPGEDLLPGGRATLEVLSRQRGFVSGSFSRATDDPDDHVLVTEWVSVGAYRRGLGAYEVKLTATTFLGLADDRPSAFEPLVAAAPGGVLTAGGSDLVAGDAPGGDA